MTDEVMSSLIEEWVNNGGFENYIKEHYKTWVISFNGSYTEVFIGDDEIDGLDDNKGFEDMYYIIQRFMLENNIDTEDDDNRLSILYEVMESGTLNIYALSEMADYKELGLEIDKNGKILYLNADEKTLSNIYNSLQTK